MLRLQPARPRPRLIRNTLADLVGVACLFGLLWAALHASDPAPQIQPVRVGPAILTRWQNRFISTETGEKP